MRSKHFIQAVMLGTLLASPSVAANPAFQDYDHVGRPSAAAYAGFTVSLRQTSDQRAKPSLRFGAGLRYQDKFAQSGISVAPRNALLEFDATAPKGQSFLVGGHRLAIGGSGAGLDAGELILAVAAVAAAALLISQVGGSNDDDDEQCLIEPELCD
jgi:hypothetical protein